jgi:hypothetical protein
VAGSELFDDLGDAILAGLLEDLGTPEALAIADIAPPVLARIIHEPSRQGFADPV